MSTTNFGELADFCWSVADLLRGDYKQADYGKVILPFTLLRRLDCVLEPTKKAVIAEYAKRKESGIKELAPFLLKKSGQGFYNTSRFSLPTLIDDSKHVRQNLLSYLADYSTEARDIFERFKFAERVAELDEKNLLFQLVQKFATIDLHPDNVPNESMGSVFEDLIHRFAEASNETAGEHFTPREVIRLMVELLLCEDSEILTQKGVVRSLYDPTAGTGGMLSVAEAYVHELNPNATFRAFGQELNDESYAICKADMLIKGQDPKRIARGNTLSDDKFPDEKFDYLLSNPPFGVEWKKVKDAVESEHARKGFAGRFGPGLPRISDGALLFLLHLVSKMRTTQDGGSRLGIVLNGSPLFTGGAGSGESEIRKYVLENDMVEAIIGLPEDMFYNTGISTYVWILSNRKQKMRKGKVQLIDGSGFWQKMKKNLGNKRKELSPDHIRDIVKMFGRFKEVTREGVPLCRIFKNEDFGYRTITVEQPQRDASGQIVLGAKGKSKGGPVQDSTLRDTENVPLTEEVEAYFKREILPHAPDAWIDEEKTKVGYEISFNRQFYVFKPPRQLAEIDAELKGVTGRILTMINRLAQ